MNVNLDPKSLRNQVKLLKELTQHLEGAAEICEALNNGDVSELPIPPLNGNGHRQQHFVPAHNFTPGNRQINLDLAYAILKEAGEPLHKLELHKRAKAKGSTITKPETFSFYMKQDSRFEKAARGHWKLAKNELVLK